ncbi:hypothetical protein TNIN_166451 [Trichonephila inaurata madagascariensis]|uniref:Peptidase S1 domain-containing protein n=1 Tax=Trichonephila inaurata madagascariensis TaxID=2747483 RepID=A0A8X6XV49_9ARAC|nr:hypothetical protein TNIN_166451 [Trichonephila inaurata madagascariensis]
MLPHPKFSYEILNHSYYDIGLLKLQTAAQLGPNVNVVCLPASSDIGSEEQQAFVVGWALFGKKAGSDLERLLALALFSLRIGSREITTFSPAEWVH